jgi:hypothetical protein
MANTLKMLRPDAKGRITLGLLAQGISGFAVSVTKEHNILLTPYTEIPRHEKWLLENETALKQVKQGLKEAAAGKLVKKGPFSQFVDNAE